MAKARGPAWDKPLWIRFLREPLCPLWLSISRQEDHIQTGRQNPTKTGSGSSRIPHVCSTRA